MNHPSFPSKRVARFVAGVFAATCCGCVVPDYHLPQGFSSTYYRHAQMHEAVKPVEPEPAAPFGKAQLFLFGGVDAADTERR